MRKFYSIEELIKTEQYDLAMQLCENEYKKNGKVSYLIQIAQIYEFQNKIKQALKILLKLNNSQPNLAAANKIGYIYFQNKKYKKAIKYYAQVVDLEGINTNNLYNLACSYHYNLDFKNAYKYYNQSLALDPNNVQALNNLGGLYFDIKDYNNAFDTFKKSLELTKKNPEAYFYLGILQRIFKHDLELSILYLKKSLFYDVEHFETYTELIKTYEELNNQEEIAKLQEIISKKFSVSV